MKTIAVTGTPCTGKTTYSKKLANKKKYFYINLNDFIKENKLREKYDRKRKTYEVDVKKLNKKLISFINLSVDVLNFNVPKISLALLIFFSVISTRTVLPGSILLPIKTPTEFPHFLVFVVISNIV